MPSPDAVMLPDDDWVELRRCGVRIAWMAYGRASTKPGHLAALIRIIKQEAALSLHEAGLDLPEIAAILGVSRAGAYRLTRLARLGRALSHHSGAAPVIGPVA